MTTAKKLLRWVPPLLAVGALAGVCLWEVDRIAARSQGYGGKQVVINEICAHNLSGLQDGNGDYGDWIELYNPGGTPVDLSGWTLSDDKDDPNRWTFPEGTILEEYLVVFADLADTQDGAGYCHTSFALKTNGKTLYLYDAQGELVDKLKYPEQDFDITYGRAFGNGSEAGTFATATPGAANPVDFLQENREAPLGTAEFSLPAGFYDDAIEVSLTADDPDALIFYTTDGSDPEDNGKLYTGAISVTSRAGEPNEYVSIANRLGGGNYKFLKSYAYEYAPEPVDKSTTITVRLYKDGQWSDQVTSSTYWIDVQQHTLPVVSVTADPEELFGQTGIYAPGFTYYTLGKVGLPGSNANFMSEEKIQARVQTVGAEKESSDAKEAEISVSGESSRVFYQMKNLSVDLAEGTTTNLLEGGKNTTSLEDFSLKGPGNGIWQGVYLDGFWNNYLYEEGLGTQYNVPVVLYLEDEYWGIYCARERKNESFIARQYDVDRDSVELYHYDAQIIADLNQELLSLDDADVWTWAEQNFDLDEFIDCLIASLYANNWDGFSTLANTILWRATEGNSERYSDGKWRLLLNDFDMVMRQGPEKDSLASLLEEKPAEGNLQHVLLKRLWKTEEFRTLFAEKFRQAMTTTYAPEQILPAFQAWCAQLYPEMERNLARQKVETTWLAPLADWLTDTESEASNLTMEEWEAECQTLCAYLEERAGYLLSYLDTHLQEAER